MPAAAAVPTRPIIALSFAACGSSAALRVCDPLLPRFTTQYGVSLGTASQAVTVFAVAYGLLQLAYGPIGDRFCKYRVVTLACLASAFTSLACALAPGFDALLLARTFAGATAGALIPLSLAWIGDAVAYERRQPVLARFLLGQMLGIAMGQLIGGVGADHFGPAPVFGVLTAWFGATSLLLWRFAPPPPAGRPAGHDRVTAAAAPAGTPPGEAGRRHAHAAPGFASSVLARFAAVLRVPWARVVLGAVFLEGVMLFGGVAFIPTHLNAEYGLPLTVAGMMVMLYGAGGIIFAMASSVLVRRLGEPGLAAGGAIILMLALATIALARVPAVAAAGCLIAGLGFYMLHNTLQVNATQMAPQHRGSSVALFASCLFMGQSAGVALGGQVAQRIGTTPVILGAGITVLVLGLAFAFARRRHRAAT
jgi:predicted MFS family arabinose efflux permease